MARLSELSAFLDGYLCIDRRANEGEGVLRDTTRDVRRIGLALDLSSATALADLPELDALLLHRWWGYESLPLDPSTGVLGYHASFDDRMGLADNPLLVSALHMSNVQLLRAGDGREIGVVGDVPVVAAATMSALLTETFGGLEFTVERAGPIRRVAAVNAMTAALVHDAHALGADVYLTGQFRQPAKSAVAETGIAVAAIGHARLEHWGLSCVAALLRERWPELRIVRDVALP